MWALRFFDLVNAADISSLLKTYLNRTMADVQVAEASHALSSILFRLNAGFVGIIERFLNGKSTYSDYHMLVNL